MTQFVIFNSHTSGNVRTEMIAGREHLVTNMVSMVADTVMNKILYPNEEVQKALPQLNMIPAPAGHPVVNGVNVSAAHPLAMNAQNIGGFIRNPRMDNKKVINEFCLDIKVANGTDDGKKLIDMINNHEKIGVSTGLKLNLEQTNGTGEDGKAFEGIGRDFQFDHVAVFVNGEKPAGDHVGTEMIFNGEKVIANELSANTLQEELRDLVKKEISGLPGVDNKIWTWVVDVFPDSKQFVYEISQDNKPDIMYRRGYSVGAGDSVILLDDKIQVERKVDFIPIDGSPVANNEESIMDNEPTNDDKVDSDASATNEQEQAGDTKLTVNDLAKAAEENDLALISNEDASALKDYKANKSAIDSMVEKHNADLKVKRDKVAKHLNLNEEQAGTLTEEVINHQFDLIQPKSDYSLNAGGDLQNNEQDGDNKQSFVINHDAEGDSDNASE